MYPLLFHPNLHELVWGGSALAPLKGQPSDGRPIGESWEISDLPGNESVVSNGRWAGRTLGSLVREHGAALLGSKIQPTPSGGFPLLVKLIDAARDLSIQVHPDDRLARLRHNGTGKTEVWYVMHARPGATLLTGFRSPVTREEYFRRVADGTITDVLARHEVHPGDVFFIPAGRVHAICGGIMVCEIQQSSDITYRIFDYNRPGLDGRPRELHTRLASDAIDFAVHPTYRTTYTVPFDGVAPIADCPYFAVSLMATRRPLRRPLRAGGSFVALTAVAGAAAVTDAQGHTVNLPEGHSCLIPAAVADYSVAPLGPSEVRILETRAK